MSNEYLRTTILECNHNNAINSNNSNNDFTVNTGKSIYCPKGTQISLDGAIINELGASNTEVIEISNENLSSKQPYTNNFMGCEMLYYINHNGQNMCACPLTARNGLLVDNRTVDSGKPDFEKFNINVVTPRQQMYIPVEYLILHFETTKQQGEDINYPSTMTDRNSIIYDERSNVNIAGQSNKDMRVKFMNSANQIYDINHKQQTIPALTPDDPRYFGIAYFYISSPANCATATRKNRPNSSKWVYMSNQFFSPVSDDELCEPFTKTANIYLGDKPNETPDQINFKITQQWTASTINSKSNIVEVDALKYDQSIPKDEIDIRENRSDVFNFSGNTLINIPANLSTTQEQGFNSMYYSNMFVEDYKWWTGGQRFLTTTSSLHEGLSPNNWTIETDGVDSINNTEIFKDYDTLGADNATFFPRIYGVCWKFHRDFMYDLGNNTHWEIEGTNADWVIWSGVKPDGNLLPDYNIGFLYSIRLVNRTTGAINTQFAGRVEPTNNKYILHIYDAYSSFQVVNPNGLSRYQIPFDDNIHNKSSFVVQEYHGTDFTLVQAGGYQAVLDNGHTYNGLPYYSFPNTNCGFRTGRSQPAGGFARKKIIDDFTAIPRGFVLPSNIKFYSGGVLENILGKIQRFFRQNEVYIGSKTTYEEQQNDWKNWIIEVQIGLHNDNAVGQYNAKDSIIDDGSRGGGVNSFTFYEKWFSGLALFGETANKDPAKNKLGDRNSAIYPVGTYTTNGVEHKTNKNVLRLMSRYNDDLYDMLRIDNIGVVNVPNYEVMGLSPNIRVDTTDEYYKSKAKEYNLGIVLCKYQKDTGNTQTNCIGFINALQTFGGDGAEHNDTTYSHIHENFGLSNIASTEMTLTNVFDNNINTSNTSQNVFDINGFYIGSSSYNGLEIDMDLDEPTDIGGLEIYKDANESSSISRLQLYGTNSQLDDNYYLLMEYKNMTALTWGLDSYKKRFYVNPEFKGNRQLKYYDFTKGNNYEHSSSEFLTFEYAESGNYRDLLITKNHNNVITVEQVKLNLDLLTYTDSANHLYTLNPATGVLSSPSKSYTGFNGQGGVITETLGKRLEEFDKLKLVIRGVNGGNQNITLQSIRITNQTINLINGVDYSLSPPQNYRQMFRLLCGVVFGFDPSATASPWGIPLNNYVGNDDDAGQVTIFRDNKYQDKIKYSSFIENYISRIFLGCVNPTIDFNISRFEFSNFHTPKKFNSKDGASSSANNGDVVAIFNDNDMNYQTCQVQFSEGEALQRFNDINYGINDSICGIGFYKLFVRDENSNGEKIGDEGVYECTLNNDLTTNFYENSLFSILGFDLIQLLPIYGRPFNRFNNQLYNVIGGFGLNNDIGNNIENLQRYKSCSFFTTNAFLSQQSTQNMSLFPPNFPDSQTENLKGLPDFGQSYVGFAKLALAVDTDVLRANEEPQRVKNPYYIITCDLPTTGYITNNNEMNSIGYAFKQYRTANYYFQYAQNFNITLTNDITISSIRTAIHNPNGELAFNIGLGSVFFYKIQFPSILSALPEKDPEEEELNKIYDKLEDIENDTDLTEKINKKDPETIPIKKALTILQDESVDNLNDPLYQRALYTVKNFVSNYLLTQIISNDRQILTDYRRNDMARFKRDLLRNLRNKRKDFQTAFDTIMQQILSNDPKLQGEVLKELREATRGMVDIRGIGMGSQIIGFPKQRGTRGPSKIPFTLVLDPEATQVIRDIMMDKLNTESFNRQMSEIINQGAFNIDTAKRRDYEMRTERQPLGRKRFDKERLDDILDRLKTGRYLGQADKIFVEKNIPKIDELVKIGQFKMRDARELEKTFGIGQQEARAIEQPEQKEE